MSIFHKLFGDSSKIPPASKSGQWDAMLAKCDLLMARDEIMDWHKMMNEQAEKKGETCYFKNEYVAAWEPFRNRPTIDTARMLLNVAPWLLQYFEICSPDSSVYSTKRWLKERGL